MISSSVGQEICVVNSVPCSQENSELWFILQPIAYRIFTDRRKRTAQLCPERRPNRYFVKRGNNIGATHERNKSILQPQHLDHDSQKRVGYFICPSEHMPKKDVGHVSSPLLCIMSFHSVDHYSVFYSVSLQQLAAAGIVV